jgi:uncharacterized protein
MQRDEIIARLNRHRPELEAMGIDHVRLFGSLARDQGGPESDVDLVVEFRPSVRVGFAIVSIHRRLEEIVGAKVDLLRAPIRPPALKDAIEREGVYAF